VVVEDQRGALTEVQRSGKGEGRERGRYRPLGHPAQRGERRHPLTGGQPGVGGCLDHLSGHLGPGDEGQLGLELVQAPGLQEIREEYGRGSHVDQHPLPGVNGWLASGSATSTTRTASGPERSVICSARIGRGTLPRPDRAASDEGKAPGAEVLARQRPDQADGGA